MVPITCFLSPWAKAGSAIRTASRSIVQRSFMFLAPSNSVIAQCAQHIQSGASRKSRKEISHLARNDGLLKSGRWVASWLSVVVLLGLGRSFARGSVQEVVFFLLFLAFIGAFRIIFF